MNLGEIIASYRAEAFDNEVPPFCSDELLALYATEAQIEACRRVLTRYTRKGGKIWIRVFPDKPITKGGNEKRMGGGKGAVDHYVAPVRPGTIIFEMDGITEAQAKEALELAAYKLPCKTMYLTR